MHVPFAVPTHHYDVHVSIYRICSLYFCCNIRCDVSGASRESLGSFGWQCHSDELHRINPQASESKAAHLTGGFVRGVEKKAPANESFIAGDENWEAAFQEVAQRLPSISRNGKILPYFESSWL